MQIALVKRQPKRRCRIPRRPHPGLDYSSAASSEPMAG